MQVEDAGDKPASHTRKVSWDTDHESVSVCVNFEDAGGKQASHIIKCRMDTDLRVGVIVDVCRGRW